MLGLKCALDALRADGVDLVVAGDHAPGDGPGRATPRFSAVNRRSLVVMSAPPSLMAMIFVLPPSVFVGEVRDQHRELAAGHGLLQVVLDVGRPVRPSWRRRPGMNVTGPCRIPTDLPVDERVVELAAAM